MHSSLFSGTSVQFVRYGPYIYILSPPKRTTRPQPDSTTQLAREGHTLTSRETHCGRVGGTWLGDWLSSWAHKDAHAQQQPQHARTTHPTRTHSPAARREGKVGFSREKTKWSTPPIAAPAAPYPPAPHPHPPPIHPSTLPARCAIYILNTAKA